MDEVTYSRTAAYVAWQVITDPFQRQGWLEAVRQAYPDLQRLPEPLQKIMQQHAR